jgi:hypothetical protein
MLLMLADVVSDCHSGALIGLILAFGSVSGAPRSSRSRSGELGNADFNARLGACQRSYAAASLVRCSQTLCSPSRLVGRLETSAS